MSLRGTWWIPLAAATILAACDGEAPPVQADDATDRIAALEERLAALEAFRALGEPPPEAWVPVDGVEWASNGHVLIRRDGPRPDLTVVRERWMTGMTAEQFAPTLDVSVESRALVRVDTVIDQGTEVARFRAPPDGPMVHVDAAYASALVGSAVQGRDPLGPVYTLAADGTIQAVVMPRRPPADGPEAAP